MDSSCCVNVGNAFKSVGYNEELFFTILQKFALFEFDDGFKEYAKQNLQVFQMAHIRLLHKNYLQSEKIKEHVWIESEKAGRDMKQEATEDWIKNYHELFNKYYNEYYWDKFVEADLSEFEHLIEK